MKNNYKKNNQPGFIEMILVTIGRGLWFVVSWPFKKLLKLEARSQKLDKVKNQERWREIEKLLESNDEIHAKHAVVEADKFFDSILKLKGGTGETFADRLRSLENHFSVGNYQLVWQAHKVRNQISHEQEIRINIDECQSILNKYRIGLINLGAI
jgi:hypothetical protein